MGEREAGELRYTAFLSYSHKDAAAAQRLHRRLETYRLPKRLVGSMAAWGPVPSRLWPIFRDREELPAATDLSETVRRALAESGSLVVLCSPHSAQSLWVAEEIATFRRIHPDRPILTAILDGEPPHCFPDLLRFVDADGTTHEPLATDLRREGDGDRLGLLKLVAGITGIGLDELVQRDASRRVRRVTAITVGAVVAMLLMAALTILALNSRAEAERQRAEAEGLIEFMLTDLRERLKGVGRLDVMTTVNERALAYYREQEDLHGLTDEELERRARILHAMGEDDLNRDRGPATALAFIQAHRTTAALLARSPNNPNRIFAHAQSEFWMGRVAYEQRNYREAQRRFTEYKLLADQLVALDGTNPEWLKEAGYADGNLCTIALNDRAEGSDVISICASALRRMEEARQRLGDDPSLLAAVVNRHAWLADAWALNQNWDRALQHRQRQEHLARELLMLDPRNADYRDIWMRTEFTLAEFLRRRGQMRAAERRYREAEVAVEQLRVLDPENETWAEWEDRISLAKHHPVE